MREEDLIDLTPEVRKEALDIVARYDHGPLYTPPSQRGTIQVPGVAGGANWSGAAIDPETGMLYVGTYRLPFLVTVRKPSPGEASYDFVGEMRYLPGPRGLPLLKPPFGSMVAIDMNTGEHRWRIPVGRSSAFPAIDQLGIREQLGLPLRSWALVTKTVMVVVQMGYYSAPRLMAGVNRRISDLANLDPHLWVYDKSTGEMLAEIPLPANATGSPISYMSGGKQYIVFPVGGGPLVEELIAVALYRGARQDCRSDWPSRAAAPARCRATVDASIDHFGLTSGNLTGMSYTRGGPVGAVTATVRAVLADRSTESR